jgi:anaerobic selenocysteine-containing dehydrogenase
VPALHIHPDDAGERALATGDTAVLSTVHGSCCALVEVTTAIRRGVVSVPHGFEEANVNRLISTADADRLSGMTITSGLAVEVARQLAPAGAGDDVERAGA